MLAVVTDWFMDNMFFFWLVVAIFFLILEMGSPGLFFFLSFFFGAMICAIAAFFTNSLVLQSIIFLVGSAVSFLLLHFWIKSKVSKVGRHVTTNIYALKGKQGKVIKKIVPGSMGEVKIFGDVWSARTLGDEVIEEGEQIEVVKIQGAHIIVQKKG